MTAKTLSIALCRPHFEAFASGAKDTEYRRFGSKWNATTCYSGRRVVLSLGYGKSHRLRGVIVRFDVLPLDQVPAAVEIYGSRPGEHVACIGIKIEPDRCEES